MQTISVYRTEYQMEPSDLSDFTNNVNLYEAAANLVYVTGEPDWRSIAMYDNLMNGDIRGGAKELGNIWSDALTNPNFWMSVATSVAVSNAGGKISNAAKTGEKLFKFSGNNPGKAPKGFEWKGKPGSIPGSKDGNWYNPKTGESLRPDLNHPKPIGPHWDYKDPSGKWWRIFPDGSNVPK
jgi:hypothetical protein